MKAVVNATPLIALSIIERIDILHQIFDEVWIAAAVYDEVVLQAQGRAGANLTMGRNWLQVGSPSMLPTIEPLLLGLDRGELHTILLAREIQADWILIDEKLARRIAQSLGLQVKGTLGILLTAYHANLLSKSTAMQAVDLLLANGIRLGDRLLQAYLTELQID